MLTRSKARWKTEAQSVKRSTQEKKEPSQVSMRTKTTMIMNKKLGRRPKRMPYEEPIGRDGTNWKRWEPYGVLKNNHQEELGRRGQRNSQKSSSQGRKVPLKKNITTIKKEYCKK